jgi:hypothetical protein
LFLSVLATQTFAKSAQTKAILWIAMQKLAKDNMKVVALTEIVQNDPPDFVAV